MLSVQLEVILFASSKPVTLKRLAALSGTKVEAVEAAVEELRRKWNVESSGIHVLVQEGQVQFVTNPAYGTLVSSLTKDELTGELTRPQLETLTIVCYRGPITKPEIEQIRGVNCSLILRNLLMRGLIQEKEDASRLQSVYSVTPACLQHLGVTSVDDLPEYSAYHDDERITKMIEEFYTDTEDV